MSKHSPNKRPARSRAARERSRFERRAARNRVIALLLAVMLALSLVAVSLALIFSGDTQATAVSQADGLTAPAPPFALRTTPLAHTT